MKWTKVSVLMAFVLLFAGLNARLMAQGHGMHQNNMGMREQRARNLENLRLLKLMEVLDLNDEQSPKFIEAYASFRKDSRQINDDLQNAVDSLAGILNADKIDKSAIEKWISQIMSLKAKREKRLVEFHNEIGSFLTTEQMGRLVVFEERFERELIENVRGFRMGQMSPDNP
jgi:Spy/CpxP family protein refolding chaperone